MRVGIDSSLAMYAPAPADPSITILQDATAWLGRKPDFVIRPSGTGGGAATPLSTDECIRLHADGLGILPYYNDSPLNWSQNPPTGTYELGQQDAAKAKAQVAAIGIPANFKVPGDIENNAPVTPDYIQGWADAWSGGMLYGLCGPGGNLGQAVLQALQNDKNGNVHRLLLWPAEWLYKGGLNYSLAATHPWNPVAPSPQTFGMLRLWQISGNDFNGIVDQDICMDDFYNMQVWLPVVPQTVTVTNPGTNPALPFLNQAQASLAQGMKLLG